MRETFSLDNEVIIIEEINIHLVSTKPEMQENIHTTLARSDFNYRINPVKNLQQIELEGNGSEVILVDYDSCEAQSELPVQNISIPVIGIGNKNRLENIDPEIHEISSFLATSELSNLSKLIKLDLAGAKNNRIIHSENDLLKFVLNNSLNEVFVLDAQSRKYLLANQTFLNNIGFTLKELQQVEFEQTIASHQLDLINFNLDDFWAGNVRKLHLQKETLRKDGSFYPVQLKLEYINYNQKLIILGVGVDISERKRNRELLNNQTQIAKKLEIQNKYKSEFYASLSHEMKTTLNSVQIISRILAEDRNHNLQQDQLEYIETIHNSTSNLLSLLNDVLNVSKLESNKIGLNLEFIHISTYGRDLEKLFQPVAQEKNIEFEFINEFGDECTIKSDSLRLEQILKNLISNALKFTQKGFVKLRVYQPKVHPLKSEDVIAFDVIDSGIGISAAKQKTVFDSYIQAEGSNTEKIYGGTGLGLSISDTIAGFLGGKIEVHSKLKKGSTFTLYLPADSTLFVRDHQKDFFINESQKIPQTFENGNETKKHHLNSGNILLIDDNKTHNQALQDYLNYKINKCFTAESAEGAFKLLSESKVDCIILDYYLPDMNGYEVLKKLKESTEFQKIPIILYSGKTLSAQEEKKINVLSDAIIQKNAMSYKVLLNIIHQLLEK